MTKLYLTAAALIALSLPAFAQESQTFDPMGSGNAAAEQIRAEQERGLGDKGFIKPQQVLVSVTHPDYMDEDQFALQLAVPDVVSGCYELTPLEYEANFVDPYFLDIKVKHYRRTAPEGAAATTTCDRKNQRSTAVMPLSRADVQARGTKEIRFTTDAGRDIYDVIWDGPRLELKPQSMIVFKPENMSGSLKDRISYTFTGNSVIALHVPMAQPGEDISQQLMQFAQMRALTPAEGGDVGSNGNRIYFFTDNGGHIASEIGPDGYAEIGKIVVPRPYDAPDGRKMVGRELSVFVTRPGTQL